MCALFDLAIYPTEYGSRDFDLIAVGNATTDHRSSHGASLLLAARRLRRQCSSLREVRR